MRYLDSSGRVRQQQSFLCGACGRDATPNLEFRDHIDTPPLDLRIDCPHCGAYVATVNPAEASASIAPSSAAATPEAQAAASADASLERDEAAAAADMQTEADVADAVKRP